MSEPPGEPVKMQTAAPTLKLPLHSLVLDPGIGISNEFLSHADATGPRTTLCMYAGKMSDILEAFLVI